MRPTPAPLATPAGALLRISGVVQGVGFRPFVHRLAARNGLAGWVRNTPSVVEIAVQGDPQKVETFVGALRAEAPALARIERIEREPWAGDGRPGFSVKVSATGDGRQNVAPDAAICAACARELFDPANRRYRYPFITCTDCGPRFSVIESLPYDRERTSMRAFPLCPGCRSEYENPADRRFHSETNSCPACGPRLWLADDTGRTMEGDRGLAIAEAARVIGNGGIVAVRGLGGFHLACDATNDAAVRRLRRRKHRDAKPLAVMVAGPGEAHRLADRRETDPAAFDGAERPVVVVRRRAGSALAPSISPGLDSVGVMLAYTPLHRLLLEAVGKPLVMTSGNRSDEPIAIANGEAIERLAGIADAWLLHDREIVTRYDDSVIRPSPRGPVLLRRARGLAPQPIALPVPTPRPLVAVGPHLKNTFTLALGERAWVSQHIGDLEDLAALEHFRAVYDRHRALFQVDPEVAVRDLHPGYLSTRIAAELGAERVIAVQHHHAHIAAVMAEHGLTDPVVGLAFDGTGYGDDGCVWGAEILVADLTGYRRRGHLRYAPLPGGDLAARRPWRAALGYLSLTPSLGNEFAAAFDGVDVAERTIAEVQIARGLNAPLASSMGRLFDAAAAVLGIRRVAAYEGQAAMELEALASLGGGESLPFPVTLDAGGTWIMDPVPLLAALGARRRAGGDVAVLAAAFHESVAEAAAEAARRIAHEAGLGVVALGGGSFQNVRLAARIAALLVHDGLTVLTARALPPNDGAISYGQAAVAAALLAREA